MSPTNRLLEQLNKDLRRLRLHDMLAHLDDLLEHAEKKQQGYLQFLCALVSKQVQGVRSRALQRRIDQAALDPRMSFENFDWAFQPSLHVPYLKDLAQLHFVAKRQPLLILGKTGTGKTHLATALGICACEAEYKVQFYSLQTLLKHLYATLADESTERFLGRLARLDLLIIDGVRPIRTKPEYPSLLFDLVSACQHQVALIITSSITFQEWGEMLGNPSLTHAIVDRLMHKASVVNILSGRSYRTEGPQAPTSASPPSPVP